MDYDEVVLLCQHLGHAEITRDVLRLAASGAAQR
ncbi:hypothetical protein FB473_000452 [Brooklawnia cerclae]|uniref:Uncharacterized protein n=1 Tax=Brooklawnia cerclae TaxID=349934 RepID=A0ABX0SGJ9_9ACTN|nr:hypothetical protein [Brooklawnia cerclae]